MNTRPHIEYFVSLEGDDSWSGRLDSPNTERNDGPFATLGRARDAIRELKYAGGFTSPVDVFVREGTYYLEGPLRLNAGDSGTADKPISYRSFPGERAVLCGSRIIDNWKPYEDKIFRAWLPEVACGQWWFRQLFCNGRRMIRSRYPKLDCSDPVYGGWAFVEEVLPDLEEGFEYSKMQLGPKCEFAIDADKLGIEHKWFAPNSSEPKWSQIQTGSAWQKQGYKDYHGWGWYRMNFTVSEDFKVREHLWLLFGAVDKEAIVYIDGLKVFEHTVDLTGLNELNIWNRPFKFEVTKMLNVGQKCQMTVLVKSEFGAGGIWQNVWLVNSNCDFDPAIFSANIKNPKTFRYNKEFTPQRWAKPQQAEVCIIPGLCWLNDIIPIQAVDKDKATISLARPVVPSVGSLSVATSIRKGNRFYVENILEELSEPGQWCLDKETGYLYSWPPADDIDHCLVTAPITNRLIEIRGSSNEPVTNLTIEGLTLTQTLSCFPNPDVYYKTPNSGQALYLENTENCTITNNTFDAVGGDAIRLQNKNHNNQITANLIHHSGGYGIFVASYQKGLCRNEPESGDIPSPPDWAKYPKDHKNVAKMLPESSGHVISNNDIYNVGIIEKHSCGIAFYGVTANDVCVRHNRIRHTPRFGIALLSGLGNITIEYNHLVDISLETCDTGGVCANRWYTYKGDPRTKQGNIVRYNLIRNVVGCGAYGRKAEPGGIDKADGRIWTQYYSWGIYFDNAPMDVQVYGNICNGNALGGIMISHYGRDVTVENNMFLNSSRSQVYLMLGGQMSNISLNRNIFYYSADEADFVRINTVGNLDLAQVISSWDNNIYWNTSGHQISFSGVPGEAVRRMMQQSQSIELTFDKWKVLGYDTNTIIADPKFAGSLEDNDYSLEDDSPAWQIGFTPICTEKIGLIGRDGL